MPTPALNSQEPVIASNTGATRPLQFPARFRNSRLYTALRHFRRGFKALLHGTPQSDTPAVIPFPTQYLIPVAVNNDDSVQLIEERDWRNHFRFKLNGKGLEIGPLHRPLPVHPGMKMDYVDRLTLAQLKGHYPELKDLPLVEPTIIGDAESLDNIPDAAYDFVVSAHVIEHMKNPLRALENWCRVTRRGGLVYLIVPDKRVTFDRKRPRTTLEHMILDYQRPSAERDFEHALDYGLYVHEKHAGDAVKEGDNIVNTGYSIHYHVFIPQDIVNLLNWFSSNIRPITILEGPVKAPESDEFHLLIEVDGRLPSGPSK